MRSKRNRRTNLRKRTNRRKTNRRKTNRKRRTNRRKTNRRRMKGGSYKTVKGVGKSSKNDMPNFLLMDQSAEQLERPEHKFMQSDNEVAPSGIEEDAFERFDRFLIKCVPDIPGKYAIVDGFDKVNKCFVDIKSDHSKGSQGRHVTGSHEQYKELRAGEEFRAGEEYYIGYYIIYKWRWSSETKYRGYNIYFLRASLAETSTVTPVKQKKRKRKYGEGGSTGMDSEGSKISPYLDNINNLY